MKLPNVSRGPLDVSFSVFIVSNFFALTTFVFNNEGTLVRSSRVAPLVGPTSGDTVGLRLLMALRETTRTTNFFVAFVGITAVVVCLAADPALPDGHMLIEFLRPG